MNSKISSWIARVIIIVILGQTLFFKFTDAPETVEIFRQLGLGAAGYKAIGVVELFACILLLLPHAIIYGALLSFGLMSGALFAHLTQLGFAGEMASLGLLAIVAWILSLLVLILHRQKIPFYTAVFKSQTVK